MNVRPYFSGLRAVALALSLAVVPLISHAVAWDNKTDFAWNVGNGNITAFPQQGSGQMWSSGTKTPTSTGPQWKSPPKALPFNPSPTFDFKAKFTPSNMARALLNPINLIPFAAAPILNELLNQACVRMMGGTMGLAPGGQWEECIMTQQNIYATVKYYNSYKTGLWSSSSAACAPLTSGSNPNNPTYGFWCYSGQTVVQSGYQVYTCNGTTSVGERNAGNANNPPVCGTGLVESGNYAPISNAAAEAKLSPKLDAWSQADFLYGFDSATGKPSGGTRDVLDAIMNTGNPVTIDPATISATGPATLPGAPVTTTTTNPDGSTITKITNTTNHYTTGPVTNDNRITITHTTTTTTTTTNNTTQQTTTETTEAEAEPDKTTCEKYPDTIGCSRYGTAEAGTPITKDTKAISITSATFSGGSCPGPIAFQALGRSYAFEYNPLCDRLAGLAPLFLALSALLAAWIFADGFRVT